MQFYFYHYIQYNTLIINNGRQIKKKKKNTRLKFLLSWKQNCKNVYFSQIIYGFDWFESWNVKCVLFHWFKCVLKYLTMRKKRHSHHLISVAMETKGYIYLIRICWFCLTIFSDWFFFFFFFFLAILVSLRHIFVCHSLQHTVKVLSIMSPKVMYLQQQIYSITFGMNVINWHASTDNWVEATKLHVGPVKMQISQLILDLFYGNVKFDPIGKNMYKIQVKETFLNLHYLVLVTKCFIWH